MSGAAALAAARRRRAGPPQQRAPIKPMVNPSHQLQPRTNSNNILSDNQSNPPPPPNLEEKPTQIFKNTRNPNVLLLQHNTIITTLQKQMNDVTEKLSENDKKLNDNNDPNTINYFKRKYEEVERQLNEMKKLVIKVQTFAMQTNLELMKYKNQEIENNNVILTDSEINNVSNLLIEENVDAIIENAITENNDD